VFPPSIGFVGFLRVVRLLRVFRLIQENPFLRKETDSFFVSFGSLGPILVRVCAVTYFFGLVGLHLLKGVTEYRCRETPAPVNDHWVADPTIRNLCGQRQCPEHLTCGAPTEYGLHFDKHELASLEFFYGFNNFDTVNRSSMSLNAFSLVLRRDTIRAPEEPVMQRISSKHDRVEPLLQGICHCRGVVL
jgi:hypothetical protein